MKDTKVFVDLDDEITFISEKIIRTPTNRVILVVPERSGIITSLVGLKMLRKVIDKFEKDVVIVTTDKQGKNIALNAGYISVDKIGEVDEDIWKESVRLKKRLHDSLIMSNKIPYKEDIFQSVDNTNDLKENKEIIVPEKKDETPHKENIRREVFENEKPLQKSKKISFEGFDLIAGGDAASYITDDDIPIKKDNNEETKKPINRGNLFKSSFYKDTTINNKRNKLILYISVFIILLIFIIYYLFLTTANISISVLGKNIKSNTKINLSLNVSHINPNTLTIPAQIYSASESGSNSINTTGQKNTVQGNYASGSVIFYNSTNSAVTIPSNTTFTDNNQYSFTTTNSVSVPAAQSSITGVQNGASSSQNVSLNTNTPPAASDTFSNPNYTGILASNQNAFTQGNAQIIKQQVVSSQDYTNLENNLSQSLFKSGQQKLLSQNNNVNLIKQSIKNIVVNKSFDHQIGDVAQVLNLSENTKTEAQGYISQDITKVISENIQNKGDLIKNLKYTILNIQVSTLGEIQISLSYTGKLYKNINKSEIISKIKGKSFSQARSYIKSLNNIQNISITSNPYIFTILGFLPSNSNNIYIHISN